MEVSKVQRILKDFEICTLATVFIYRTLKKLTRKQAGKQTFSHASCLSESQMQ
jgi:hypothetical protein